MLHPSLEKQLGFDTPVFLFELAQDSLLTKRIPKFKALSKFPSVRRDLALIVKEGVSAGDIINCVNSEKEADLKDVVIFDLYRGKGVDEGHKSIALSLSFQNEQQTLTDSEIDAILDKVLARLGNSLNAKLRD
jgi:phenylalanyl-tRNA synthetase beta chain